MYHEQEGREPTNQPKCLEHKNQNLNRCSSENSNWGIEKEVREKTQQERRGEAFWSRITLYRLCEKQRNSCRRAFHERRCHGPLSERWARLSDGECFSDLRKFFRTSATFFCSIRACPTHPSLRSYFDASIIAALSCSPVRSSDCRSKSHVLGCRLRSFGLYDNPM